MPLTTRRCFQVFTSCRAVRLQRLIPTSCFLHVRFAPSLNIPREEEIPDEHSFLTTCITSFSAPSAQVLPPLLLSPAAPRYLDFWSNNHQRRRHHRHHYQPPSPSVFTTPPSPALLAWAWRRRKREECLSPKSSRFPRCHSRSPSLPSSPTAGP